MKTLNKKTQQQVDAFIEQGNEHTDNEKYSEAFNSYRQALLLFPDPLEEREETMWLLSVMGDSLFEMGEYEKAIGALSDAIRCGGLGNPFIHLRLGQAQFEVGNLDKAADELTRAYMAEGEEIFENDSPKYFEFLKTRITL